jgi:hypothetical protein
VNLRTKLKISIFLGFFKSFRMNMQLEARGCWQTDFSSGELNAPLLDLAQSLGQPLSV